MNASETTPTPAPEPLYYCVLCQAVVCSDVDAEHWPYCSPRCAMKDLDPLSHAAQAIHVASGDLLDLVRDGDREVCLRLRPILHGVLERLSAVDELVTRTITRED